MTDAGLMVLQSLADLREAVWFLSTAVIISAGLITGALVWVRYAVRGVRLMVPPPEPQYEFSAGSVQPSVWYRPAVKAKRKGKK